VFENVSVPDATDERTFVASEFISAYVLVTVIDAVAPRTITVARICFVPRITGRCAM
jgi:hypothetical protein